jgi:TonB family protein
MRLRTMIKPILLLFFCSMAIGEPMSDQEYLKLLECGDECIKNAKPDYELEKYIYSVRDEIQEEWDQSTFGMKNPSVLLSIRLDDNANVIKLKVVKTSGSDAFDGSAVAAVKAASPFEGLKNLEDKKYNEHFKSFNLDFRPLQ